MTRPANGRIAVYTGTFDPITFGHLDIIRRGSTLFERLVVGVGLNPEKTTFLTPDKRLELVQREVASFPNVLRWNPLFRAFNRLHFVRQVGAW